MTHLGNQLQLMLGAGLIAWVSSCTGFSLTSPDWILFLLLFSPIVLMPLARPLLERCHPTHQTTAEVLATILLVGGVLADSTALWAILWTLPWLGVRTWAAWRSFRDWMAHRNTASPAGLCLFAARGFPMVGAVWLVAWRSDWMPLGFSPLIVLLTAAHFHHAGFTLPLIAGLTAKYRPSIFSINACRLILAGVPLVAIGITCTHFQTALWIEPISVTLLVLGAIITAAIQIGFLFDSTLAPAARALMGLGGVCLLGAMILAAGFGLRLPLPMIALPMNQMWAIHGTLNALGFGTFALLGWGHTHAKIGSESAKSLHT